MQGAERYGQRVIRKMTARYVKGAEKLSKIDELIEGIEEVQFRKGGVARASEAHTDDLTGDTIIPLAEGVKLAKAVGDQTAKADAGKIRPTLVPTEAIEDIAIVRGYGNRKYGSSDNWKTVEVERYRDALFRHLLAYIKDPKSKDEESGLYHYQHLICNAAFICALERKTNEE